MTILLISLLAAVASLGMYTFNAPLLADPELGAVRSVTPYLWIWGIGGVLGSFLVGPVVARVRGPVSVSARMEIGRESYGDSVCQYVWIPRVAVPLKKKK